MKRAGEIFCGVICAAGVLFLIATVFGCAALSSFFDSPASGGPPPAKGAQDAATAIGGPIGLIAGQLIGLAALAWQTYRALPAVEAKRHAKHSSKPA